MGETARGPPGEFQPQGGPARAPGSERTAKQILRQSALLVGSDVSEQRRLLRALVSAQPLSAC